MVAVLDAAANVLLQYTYTPYGEVAAVDDLSGGDFPIAGLTIRTRCCEDPTTAAAFGLYLNGRKLISFGPDELYAPSGGSSSSLNQQTDQGVDVAELGFAVAVEIAEDAARRDGDEDFVAVVVDDLRTDVGILDV